ncbi:MAG: hypothetical protein KDK41_07500 [Leptospiraceae bacterium]|nr:hypothetical protein [Leptospiraceae bacterium]
MKSALKIISCLMLLFGIQNLWGVGSITLGIYTGISPDMNDIASNIPSDGGDTAAGLPIRDRGRRDNRSFQNNLIEHAIGEGASGSTFAYPMGVHLGIDFRYNINNFFLRAAMEYETLLLGKTASLATASFNNSSEINSFSTNMPLTIGINHSLKEFIQFNIGVGPYMSYGNIKITHTEPNAFTETLLGSSTPTLVPYKTQEISGFSFGYHFLLGVQVPIVEKKYYLSIDYLAFTARSPSLPVAATDASGNTVSTNDRITRNGATISIGIQYYIGI